METLRREKEELAWQHQKHQRQKEELERRVRQQQILGAEDTYSHTAEHKRLQDEWRRTADQRLYHQTRPPVERGPAVPSVPTRRRQQVVLYNMLPDFAKEQVQLEYQDRIAENREYFETYGYPTTQTYYQPGTFEPWTILLPPAWNPKSRPLAGLSQRLRQTNGNPLRPPRNFTALFAAGLPLRPRQSMFEDAVREHRIQERLDEAAAIQERFKQEYIARHGHYP
jgi:hypothetical protein